jgi:hypothetical protein
MFEREPQMQPVPIRKLIQAYDVWTPVAFSATLSVITLVTYVATGLSDAWIVPFVAFQPMMFIYIAFSQRQDRRHIKMLEARIPQLSLDKSAGY